MIICFFGDSLTLGFGDDSGLGWPGRIMNTLVNQGRDVTGYNLGIRANTTIKLYDRWRRETVRRVLPDQELRLTFSFGVADIANSVHSDLTLSNAEAILTEAITTAPTLMIGPTPVADPERNAHLKSLSGKLAGICEQHQIPFVPVIDAMQGSSVYTRALGAFDNVHPSADGYAALAGHLLQTNTVRTFFGLEPTI
ncbi:GDSL-type esterase/lipase family protein [Pseudodesulfovibrio sp. S3-i]|uniref:GDSL-type esterase/lipase family protein n=1 Tax=Pseudodesulfovibrio sp. S3-i TaxID=2929474 RepID=UPI001FBB4CEA|nr:GDSL-type esterase/lipase family protein [Pseudodesulfovibrio sp. S3-i]MCJ2166315.1 GDSL-type esterase/lipase family protein [Pseudodesulfovibrio sp. S3-i]